MYSPTCNSFQLGSRAPHRKLWVYRTLGLCCLALVVVSGGCRKDSAEWKVAAATNEQANENPEAAIELLQKALQMDPESSFIKLRLARLLAENDQGDLGLTRTKKRFLTSLTKAPTNSTSWPTFEASQVLNWTKPCGKSTPGSGSINYRSTHQRHKVWLVL